MEKPNSYSHILKYTSMLGSAHGLNIAVGIVRNKLVAVILGPAGMGVLAMLASILKFLGDSTNLGISISAVREMSEAYESGDHTQLAERIHTFRTWNIGASLLGLAVGLALALPAGQWTLTAGIGTLGAILIGPTVALTTFAAGELAVLKATRRLRHVALSSVVTALASTAVTIPIYYIWGIDGIMPSLLCMAATQAAVVAHYSTRVCPMHTCSIRRTRCSGRGMLRMGTAFVLAGMVGSGTEMLIRAYIGHTGGAYAVGIYNAAYIMVFTYAGMAFASMDSDYYPRLSSVSNLGREFNRVVSSQIEVSLHIVSPMLVAFILVMPMLLPLLYSGKFAEAVPVVQAGALSVYARAMYLPIEYIALSRGHSLTYLSMELIAATLLVVCTTAGFDLYGLAGVGIGMTVAALSEFLAVASFYRHRYGYTVNATLAKTMTTHTAAGLCAYALTFACGHWWYIPCALSVALAEIWHSARILRHKTGRM